MVVLTQRGEHGAQYLSPHLLVHVGRKLDERRVLLRVCSTSQKSLSFHERSKAWVEKGQHLVKQLEAPNSRGADLPYLLPLLVDDELRLGFAHVLRVDCQQQVINQILALTNLHQLYNIFYVCLCDIELTWLLAIFILFFIEVFECVLSCCLWLKLLADSHEHLQEVLLVE